MAIYTEEGYFDFPALEAKKRTYNLIIGARGTGKTYGALKWAARLDKPFIYLRRTQTEADLISSPLTNPYKKVAADLGMTVTTANIAKNVGGIYEDTEDGMRLICYTLALSTIGNVKGVDFSDVDLIIYDEFIPQRSSRPIRDEGRCFNDLLETVGRNRELEGRDPVRVFCLANSNDIANPIFIELGIVERVYKMMQKGLESYFDDSRSLAVYMLSKSPISERKSDTALYKLSKSDYSDMAIRNMFSVDDRYIRSSPLKEYQPVVRIGEMVIYRHKSRDEMYVRMGSCGTVPDEYGTHDSEKEMFQNRFAFVYLKYLMGGVFFENESAQVYFSRMYK